MPATGTADPAIEGRFRLLREAIDNIEEARGEVTARLDRRDNIIRMLLAEGASLNAVADAAGMTKQMVAVIRDGSRSLRNRPKGD